MLQIRTAQMEAFEAAAWDQFEHRLVEWLLLEIPALGDDASEQVKAGLRKCREYGFETERQIGEYMYLRITYGDGFDDQPWIAETLRSANLDPDAKIDLAGQILRMLKS